jgi:hypothetical protein
VLRSSGVLLNVRDPQDYDIVLGVPEALHWKPSADSTGALLVALCACLSSGRNNEPSDDLCVCAPLTGDGDAIRHGCETLAAPNASFLIKALHAHHKLRKLVVPRGAVAAMQAGVLTARRDVMERPSTGLFNLEDPKEPPLIDVVGVGTAVELLRVAMPFSVAEDPRASTLLLELNNVDVYKLPDWDGEEVRSICIY